MDWVLLFDFWYKDQGKLRNHWLGPHEISKVFSNGAMQLKPIDGDTWTLLVNGHRLHIYDKLVNREEFTRMVEMQGEIQCIDFATAELIECLD